MANFDEILEEVKNKSHDPQDDVVENSLTPEQMVEQAIVQCDPNVVLRNLAYWLDIAIAKGRHVDFVQQQAIMEQQKKDNGVLTSDNNTESEV